MAGLTVVWLAIILTVVQRWCVAGLTIEDVERVGTKPSAETQPEHNPVAEDDGSVQQGAQRIMTVVSRGGKKELTTPAKRQQQQQQQQPVTAQHPVQPQLASQPPQQFAGQHYQQQSAVFSSLPPQQQQQQQHQHNPGVFNNPGFTQQQQQQQFQPPQQPFQPVRQQQQPPQQMSPAPLAQSPFKSQPFQQNQQPPPAAPQQFQSPPPRGQFAQAAHGQFPPRQFEFQQPQPQPQQQPFLPHESGDAPGAAQHGRQQFQNRQAILGAVVGRGTARGMASGQVASVRGQGPTGRGQGAGGRGQVVRGRGQVGRGGGQLSRGRGMPVGVAASPQRAMSASSGPQASSNRVVIPVGGGRGIPQGAASAPPSGRLVVQRQVAPRGADIKSKVGTLGRPAKLNSFCQLSIVVNMEIPPNSGLCRDWVSISHSNTGGLTCSMSLTCCSLCFLWQHFQAVLSTGFFSLRNLVVSFDGSLKQCFQLLS